jgi:hypothetical protein
LVAEKRKTLQRDIFLPFDFGIERSRKGFAVAVNFKEEKKTLGNGQKIVPHFSLSLSLLQNNAIRSHLFVIHIMLSSINYYFRFVSLSMSSFLFVIYIIIPFLLLSKWQ